MSQYKITKKRLAEIIKEEYEAAMERTDEAHCGGDHAGNRDEEAEDPDKADLDKDKADLDKDGKLSGYEKKRGKAIQKAMKKESLDSIRTLIQQELKNL